MFREIEIKDALENLLEEKPVLAAPISRNENQEKRRYTFRSLSEILSKYRFLVEEERETEITVNIHTTQAHTNAQPKEKDMNWLNALRDEKENIQVAPPSEPQKEKKIKDEEGYTGFLHISCECGNTKSFCAKGKMKSFKCEECGRITELKDLKRAYLNCECGGRFRYYTNETADMFDLECLNCGQPVALKYNEKKKLYETIKQNDWRRYDGK